jgi:hypothetical protein
MEKGITKLVLVRLQPLNSKYRSIFSIVDTFDVLVPVLHAPVSRIQIEAMTNGFIIASGILSLPVTHLYYKSYLLSTNEFRKSPH